MADNLTLPYNRRRVLTIDDLTDDDLLAIFDFFVDGYHDLNFIKAVFNHQDTKRKIELWQSLVHVCRRWRCLVFASPRRLNLQLYCTPRIFARKTLDIWPALPLVIVGDVFSFDTSVDDAIAVLENSDRISQIYLNCHTTSHIEKLWTAMQVPFPELTALWMSFFGYRSLPDSFLGGSAPRLRYLYLHSIPFPGLPNLLLSATHLVELYLRYIPYSRYISPEAMVTYLPMLTSLQTLEIEFDLHQIYPDLKSQHPSPPTRSVLPALTKFSFKGINEYLEEFVARIDAPQLYRLLIVFFSDNDLKAPELNQFITRTRTLGAYEEAHLFFFTTEDLVRLFQSHLQPFDHRMVEVKIFCHSLDRQHSSISSLAQICTVSIRPLLTIENLYIEGMLPSSLTLEDYMENTEWLELLLPFTAVKNLYLCEFYSPCIALALQELTGGRTTEVLPALQNILLEGFQPSKPIQEGIAQFISARQLTNHPVTISVWDRELV